jgi:hypothetical protein
MLRPSILAVLPLGACFNPRPMVDFGESGFFDTAGDDTSVPDDSDDVDATGSVEITYSFGGAPDPLDACAAANVSLLEITFEGTDATVGPVSYPCVDAAVRIGEIAPSPFTVSISGETEIGVLFAASAEILIEPDTEAALTVVLVCEENGVDDGCGGA